MEIASTELPHDALVHVFDFLQDDVRALCVCSYVCKAWARAAKDQQIWMSIYRRHYKFSKSPGPSTLHNPKSQFRIRQQIDKQGRASLAALVFPKARHASLRQLIGSGEDIMDCLHTEIRLEGSEHIGRRYWAGVALSRVQADCSTRAITARIREMEGSPGAPSAVVTPTWQAQPLEQARQLDETSAVGAQGYMRMRKEWNSRAVACCVECAINMAAMFDSSRKDIRECVMRGLDALGTELKDSLGDIHRGSLQALECLNATLVQPRLDGEVPRLTGNREHFYSPDNSLLHRVLETGVGIPITLSVIIAAVADRAGMHMELVGAPGHFLTRFPITEGPSKGETRWLSAFRGETYKWSQLAQFDHPEEQRTHDAAVSAVMFNPMAPSEVICRILRNLLPIFIEGDPPERCVMAMHLLVELVPHVGSNLIEHIAMTELRMGNAEAAQEAINECLVKRGIPASQGLMILVSAELKRQQGPEDIHVRKRGINFRVGDNVRHLKYHYRGVIWGWDSKCKATPQWQAQMGIASLTYGNTQPFYHVLADSRDRPGNQSTYVAQENLELRQGVEGQPHDDYLIRNSQIGEHFDGADPAVLRYLPNLYRNTLFPQG